MKISIRNITLVLMIFCSSQSVTSVSFADDSSARQLLDDCWSIDKKADSDHIIRNETKRTAQNIWAYALVKARQHDIAKSISAIEALQKIEPTNAKPIRLKTWLLLRQDKFDAALVSVAKYISVTNSDPDVTANEQSAAYQFAGKVFGFLDGPVAYRVDRSNRDAALNQVLSGLNSNSESAFDSAYQAVVSKFTGMMDSKQKVDKAAAIQDAKIRNANYQQLSAMEDQLNEAERRVGNERSEFRNTATKALGKIQSQQLPITSRLANHYHHGYGRHYHSNKQGSSSSQSGKVHNGKSHGGKFHHVNGHLYGNIYGLQAHRNALNHQYNSTRAFASHQLASLNKELKEISKSKQRTASKKLRLLKPSGKIVTKSVALKAKSRSITTYEQYPLEFEKQLLLASLK